MDILDYFISACISIKNKFIVEIVYSDDDDDEETESLCNSVKEENSDIETEPGDNEKKTQAESESESESEYEKDFVDDALDELAQCTYDLNNKFVEFAYVPRKWEWRKPELNEFSVQELGTVLLTPLGVVYVLYHSYNVLKYMATIFVSFFTGFAFVAYLDYYTGKGNQWVMQRFMKDLETEKEMENSFDFKYNMFLNDKYIEYHQIYQDSILKDESFNNQDKTFIESLQKKENHYEMTMPYDNSIKVIIYYDHEDDAFLYYTNRSAQQYKVCNAICRNYLYDKNCINLFQDEEEIDYLLHKYEKDISLDKADGSQSTDTAVNADGSFDDLTAEMENAEKEEPKKSIFYSKKSKTNSKSTNKDDKPQKINKFIYKGNLNDYELKFNKKVLTSSKQMDYNEYKKLMDKMAS